MLARRSTRTFTHLHTCSIDDGSVIVAFFDDLSNLEEKHRSPLNVLYKTKLMLNEEINDSEKKYTWEELSSLVRWLKMIWTFSRKIYPNIWRKRQRERNGTRQHSEQHPMINWRQVRRRTATMVRLLWFHLVIESISTVKWIADYCDWSMNWEQDYSPICTRNFCSSHRFLIDEDSHHYCSNTFSHRNLHLHCRKIWLNFCRSFHRFCTIFLNVLRHRIESDWLDPSNRIHRPPIWNDRSTSKENRSTWRVYRDKVIKIGSFLIDSKILAIDSIK